jgi:hypothetical protein
LLNTCSERGGCGCGGKAAAARRDAGKGRQDDNGDVMAATASNAAWGCTACRFAQRPALQRSITTDSSSALVAAAHRCIRQSRLLLHTLIFCLPLLSGSATSYASSGCHSTSCCWYGSPEALHRRCLLSPNVVLSPFADVLHELVFGQSAATLRFVLVNVQRQ